MTKAKDYKRRAADLKRGIKRAIQAAQTTGGAGPNVNVAHRVNAVIASNVGQDDSTREATATQRVHIRQNGGETVEETKTIQTTS